MINLDNVTLGKGWVSQEDMAFLRQMVVDVFEESTSRDGEELKQGYVNHLGISIIRPGGRGCYPALWVRDFIMSLESGLFSVDVARECYRCIASHQAKERLEFSAGGFVEAGTIPDHVSLDNEPIYFPGTYVYANQGMPEFGRQASFDDNFFFIDGALRIPGLPLNELFPKLELAYHAVPSDEEGLLVYCEDANRGVSFGFMDAITQTGNLLFASLLKCRAARTLAKIASQIGNGVAAVEYRRQAMLISEKVVRTFMTSEGLLKASTGKSCQTDVWGSAFAVYENLVPQECQAALCRGLALLLSEGQIAREGQLRHIPLREGGWSDTFVKEGHYQNGAYWATPVGWVAYAAARSSKACVKQLIADYFQELRTNDFRKGAAFEAPAECLTVEGVRQNGVYLTSVACPYAAFLRMNEELALN